MKDRLAPRGAMWPALGRMLRPVVGVDVDGTLAEYHEHFAEYAEMFLQRPVKRHWDGSYPYWRSFGVSKAKYREMKLGYRQGRMKRSLPVLPGARDFTQAVRAAGAELWVCTTRPWLRLDNIDPDTRFWLQQQGIRYDGVLFGETKYRDLARLVGSYRVVAVLDDEPEQVAKAIRMELPGILLDRPYNWRSDVPRVPSLWEAENQVLDRISEYCRNGTKKGKV